MEMLIVIVIIAMLFTIAIDRLNEVAEAMQIVSNKYEERQGANAFEYLIPINDGFNTNNTNHGKVD
jgi:type II secretory pathway component PulJ